MKPRNPAMRDAVKRAASRDTASARDLAYTLAEKQRDNATARTSPGYERFMRSRARRIAGAAVAITGERRGR